MKFLYEYRTRDNAVHRGEVSAATRDAAYAALKAQGIRPSRMTEAPGLANALFGKGKRWIAIGVLTLLLAALAVALVGADHRAARLAGADHRAARLERETQFLNDRTRHQVIGDAAVIQKGILDGWSDVFSEEGERFLAGFAIPGMEVSVRNTTEGELRAALARRIVPSDGDTLEARQIKAMVEGMKDELRQFLTDGGSVTEYGQSLVRRQQEEIAHYNRAKAEIDSLAKSAKDGTATDGAPADGTAAEDRRRTDERKKRLRARWEELNDHLRKMGIKLVPYPEGE